MKIDNFRVPKSSFLTVEKDLSLIVDLILRNNNLKKLLHYTTRDALHRPPLTEAESIQLFGKNIKIVPKIYVDNSVLAYIIVTFDNFTPNANNPEFRDNVISFDIICHFDQWQLEDFQLRPYRIAAELDSMLEKQYFTGIGKLYFLGANQIILNDEFAGISLMYSAIHGEEDKKHMPNPTDEQSMLENFAGIYKR